MADSFQLEIITPAKLVVKGVAEEAQIPGLSGYLGILPGHAPLITELAVGAITYKAGGREHTLSVCWGFVEVLPDRVTILAQNAIKPEELDAGEAQRQLEGGQKLWNEAGEDPEKYAQANEIIHEAQVKLASAHAG